MQFIVIENDPHWAKLYETSGVERVMVDLEVLGKAERQGHLDTVRSNHTPEDISAVRSVLERSKLIVRVNPWHPGSRPEIADAISRGADFVMLPMFRTPEEVIAFTEAVAGQAKTMLLLETPQALVRARQFLDVAAVDEIFIGLNDLSLGLNLDFLFESLAGGLIDHLAAEIRRFGKPFGFGGVGSSSSGEVPGLCVIREHARLGSELVILSRTFRALARAEPEKLNAELAALRSAYHLAKQQSAAECAATTAETHRLIWAAAERRRAARGSIA
ncbi:MAG: aldolase/citrate lyase family protein [Bdellovibrionota bacterium]